MLETKDLKRVNIVLRGLEESLDDLMMFSYLLDLLENSPVVESRSPSVDVYAHARGYIVSEVVRFVHDVHLSYEKMVGIGLLSPEEKAEISVGNFGSKVREIA